jgi:hemerythrin-like domain-containing protein
MTTIIEVLALEHAVFCQVFDQIEKALAGSRSAREVKSLATVVEGLLNSLAENETNLVYSVLDHMFTERGVSDHQHHDHHEIDRRFARIHRASNAAKALRLLKKALAATREHFRREEQSVFPTLEKTLQPETLWKLGNQWKKLNSAGSNRFGFLREHSIA